MTKLIIQIPCYNEEAALPVTLAHLPRELSGVDEIEWLIIDDGSTDKTIEIAKNHGVDHVIKMISHQGLARVFMAGIHACINLGADIIVNTDADNQYNAADIPTLIEPILKGQADLVVGERPISEIEHFSPIKKFFQKGGSWFVRIVSGAPVKDAPSGFRAISRESAMRMHVFTNYTYTIETVIQAGLRGMAVVSVPIRTNKFLRESRLISNIPAYLYRSFSTIIRIFMTYRPLGFFVVPGSIAFLFGTILGLRFLYFFFITKTSSGHIQSLILTAVLLILGGLLIITGLVADLISANRKLMEDIEYRLHKTEIKINNLNKKQS